MHRIGAGRRRHVHHVGRSGLFSLSTVVPATIVSISRRRTSRISRTRWDGNDSGVHRFRRPKLLCSAMPVMTGSVSVAVPARQLAFSTAVTATTSSARRANSNWLVGGTGNDTLQAAAPATPSIGGDGNDQLQANGSSNTLDGGTGNDSLFIVGGSATMRWAAPATTGSAPTATIIILSGGDGNDWIGATGSSSSALRRERG